MMPAHPGVCGLLIALCLTAMGYAADSSENIRKPAAATGSPTQSAPATPPEKKLFRGRVVLLHDAFQQRGITAYDEMKDQVVLETPQGKLIPIISDWRGRAFFQDERLRNRKVELVGYQHDGVPYLQVLMIFTFNEQGVRQYTDYWCDICSIPMYEIKPCECCQGSTRLRFQSRQLPEHLKSFETSD